MLAGQRRGLAVRNASQLNVEAQRLYEKRQLDNAKKPTTILGSQIPVPIDPLKKAASAAPPKPASISATVKKKTYGGAPFLVSESLAADIDRYMRTVERERRIEAGFLSKAKIDGRMRGILLDWIVQIQAKFQLTNESFYLACSILDRVIEPLSVNRKDFQLVGLACIFIASKFEEVLIPNVHDYVYMAGDFCGIDNLFQAERSILKTIQFQLSFAYPSHFLRKLRVFMPPADQAIVYETSKLLIDVAMLDYSTAAWLPSEMAAASVQLAYTLLQHSLPHDLITAVGVSAEDAARKAETLCGRLRSYLDATGKLKGLRLKYKGTDALRTVDNYLARIDEDL